MRIALVLGIGSILAALAMGVIHLAFTGDPSVAQLVVHALAYVALVAFLLQARVGLAARVRTWQIRRALGRGPRPRPW